MCAGRRELKQFKPARGELSLPSGGCVCSGTKRSIVSLTKCAALADTLDLYEPYIHGDCVCNERVALHNRVLSPTVEPIEACVDVWRPLAQAIGARYAGKLRQMETTDFLSAYTGGKRKRYERAVESYRLTGLQRWHAWITMFVKPDSADPVVKGSYDPRAIQFRNPVYNYRLGTYLKPFEHLFVSDEDYTLEVPEHGKVDIGTRVFAKGLTQEERGELIAAKFEQFTHPVACGADASRYDMHVSKPILKLEQVVYNEAWSLGSTEQRSELRDLLHQQLHNKGRTMKGIKYKVTGGRMSGDMNTGLGNCVIMYILYLGFVLRLNSGWGGCVARNEWDGKWDVIIDGDDSIFFTNRCNLQSFQRFFPEHCRNMGFKMEVEAPAFMIEHIDFCQGRPVWTPSGWVLVRNPRKALSTSLAVKRKVRNVEEFKKHMTAVGMCELSLNAGLPILQEYAIKLMRHGKPISTRYLDNFRTHTSWRYQSTHLEQILATKQQQIHIKTRVSFWDAFGVSPAVQIALEHEIQRWDITQLGIVQQMEPIDRGCGKIIT